MNDRHDNSERDATRFESFEQTLSRAEYLDRQFTEISATASAAIGITPDALTFDTISVPIDRGARHRLLGKAGAPVSYLAARSIDIQMSALNEHIRQGAFGEIVTPVLRNGSLFTVHSGRLAEATHSEVLAAVAESLGSSAASLTASKIVESDAGLELDLVSPIKSLEVRRGDVVRGGLHIVHSRYAGQATQIYAFIYRLLCENGMMQRQCVSAQGIVRTRKPPADHPNAKEMLLDQIRRLTQQTWRQLEPQMTEFQSSTARSADVPALLRQWLQRARISTKATDAANPERPTPLDRILDAWRLEGAEASYYGAVNALTRVGTHDLELSARQRRTLLLLGGLMAFSGAHICPRCFSLLSAPSHANAAEEAA